MDTITHGLIGAVVAHATMTEPAKRDDLPVGHRLWIGGLAAAAPDLDYVMALVHPLAFIAEWHRSLTHSLVMLPLWLLLLWACLLLSRVRRQWIRPVMVTCGLSLLTHVGADLITSWGTQIFAPLSSYAPAWRLSFVIDPYFSAIILAGLLGAVYWRSRRWARGGLILLLIYLAGQCTLQAWAERLGRARIAAEGWHEAQLTVLPQPLSPFFWKLVIRRPTGYQLTFVNLLASNASEAGRDWRRFINAYRPPDDLLWLTYAGVGGEVAEDIWQRPELALYRRFARLPFLIDTTVEAEQQCHWFGDLRFVLPVMTTPFRYGLCRDATTDSYTLYRLTASDLSQRQVIAPYFPLTGRN